MILRTLALTLTLSTTLLAQAPQSTPIQHHTTGFFDPSVKPVPADFPNAPTLGRMIISKTLHGGIEATTTGQMLTAGSVTTGSAGYVAVEFIDGAVDGHKGTFNFIHLGIMDRGKPNLTVTVVPDSGTGDLTGLTGTLTLHITADGKHTYDFDYTLPSSTKP